MLKNNVLLKLLKDELEDTIFKEIDDYLQKCNNLCDDLKLDDIYINNVYLKNDVNLSFYGYLNIETVIINERDEKSVNQKYYILFHTKLNKIKENFKLIRIDEEYDISFKSDLTQDFVPKLNSEECEKLGVKFLDKYFPEMIKLYSNININTILKRINLNLQYNKLSLDQSILGMITFEDETINVYDENIVSPIIVKSNTIVIDGDIKTEYTDENLRDNFTIIHECVHYEYHQKYFYFKKISRSNYDFNGIYDNKSIRDEETKTIEVQANNIASYILMPKQVIEAEVFLNCINENSTADDLSKAIQNMSSRFNCSISALKLRLNKLGYTNLVGIYEFVNGKYIKPYLAKEKMETNETYAINYIDFIMCRLIDNNLKEKLDKNSYLYIDGHICINDKKYVKYNNKKLSLTQYALNNISECCLKFKYSYNSNYDSKNYVLCRIKPVVNVEVKFIDSGNKIANVNPIELGKNLKENLTFLKSLNGNFTDTIKKIMNEQEMTVERLAEYSNLSIRLVQNLRNNENYKPKKSTLLYICIGLELPYEYSMILFEKKGYNLKINSEEDYLYNTILMYNYNKDIFEIQELIQNTLNENIEE